MTPDVLTEGLLMVPYLLGIGGMPGWESGHPNITDHQAFAQTPYNVPHSLVLFAGVLVLLSVTAIRWWWVVAPWGLHILIDIPIHSLALFPTPFLWPVSDFRIDGVGWDHPAVWVVDVTLLLAAYALWLHSKFRHSRGST
ncbi:MAG: hypothetical protein GY867_06060 [bacterium]|nr:hypothetical protein [bacterium]